MGGRGRAPPGASRQRAHGHETARQHGRGSEPNGPAFRRERAKWRRRKAAPFLFAHIPPILTCKYLCPKAPICLQLQHEGLRGGRNSHCRQLGVGGPLQRGSDWGGHSAQTSPNLPCSLMSRPSTARGSVSDLLLDPGVSQSTRPCLAERSSQGGARAGLRDPGYAPETACPSAGPFSLLG